MSRGLSDNHIVRLRALGTQKQVLEGRLIEETARENPDEGLVKKLQFDLSVTQKGLNRVMGRPMGPIVLK